MYRISSHDPTGEALSAGRQSVCCSIVGVSKGCTLPITKYAIHCPDVEQRGHLDGVPRLPPLKPTPMSLKELSYPANGRLLELASLHSVPQTYSSWNRHIHSRLFQPSNRLDAFLYHPQSANLDAQQNNKPELDGLVWVP